MYVGLHTASLPQTLAEAQHRIIMHTAVYADFARAPDILDALNTALSRPGFKRLTIVTIPFMSRKGWIDDFLQMLRPELTIAQVEHEIAASHDFIVRLAVRHDGMVEVYETRALPTSPYIFVDDKILFGHYAHAAVHPEQGFWFGTTAPVETLLQWAQKGEIPRDATPRHRAAYRFVADCHHAMHHAKRVLL